MVTGELARSKAVATLEHGLGLAEAWEDAVSTYVACAAPIFLLIVISCILEIWLGTIAYLGMIPIMRISTSWLADRAQLTLRLLLATFRVYWVGSATLALGMLCVSIPLQTWGVDLNQASQRIATWPGAVHTVALRGIEALLPITDLPFVSFLPLWRDRAIAIWVQSPEELYQLQMYGSYGDAVPQGILIGDTRALSFSNLQIIFFGGLIGTLLAEVIFAFRGCITHYPAQMAALAWRHFGTIALHLFLVRFVGASLKVVFVFVPVMAIDYFSYLWVGFMPQIRQQTITLCVAIMIAMTSTFETVYLARLYRKLCAR